ncbi:lysozyme family protein [Streptomyces liangshanensis]|uniref:hypothetical protein n=1 Tax=Streptomyces liangshanensis TaxID=2717324 RepID=UPI0036D91828
MFRRRSSVSRPLASLLTAAAVALPLLLTPAPAFAADLPKCVAPPRQVGTLDPNVPEAPAPDEGPQMDRDQMLSFVAGGETPYGLDGNPHVYTNAQGRLAVGIGFELDGPDAQRMIESVGADYAAIRSGSKVLTPFQIRVLFDVQITAAETYLRARVPSLDSLSGNRVAALVDVMFDAGPDRFDDLEFRAMINAVSQGQYSVAAMQLKRSEWAGEASFRAKYDADLLTSAILCYVPVPSTPTWFPKRDPLVDERIKALTNGAAYVSGMIANGGHTSPTYFQKYFKSEQTCEATFSVETHGTSVDLVISIECRSSASPTR